MGQTIEEWKGCFKEETNTNLQIIINSCKALFTVKSISKEFGWVGLETLGRLAEEELHKRIRRTIQDYIIRGI